MAAALTQLSDGSGSDGMKAGAIGAITASAMTDHLVSALYGKDVSQLTADEKRLVSSLVAIAGGVAGAAGTDGDLSMAAIGASTAHVDVTNNSLRDKNNPPINIIDINQLGPKILDENGEPLVGGGGIGKGKGSAPKVPLNLQPFTNPAQGPVIPQGWVSRPGRAPGSTIYYPPNTDPSSPGSTYIRVMPPGSTPVPGLENGYWISVKNGQPANPATGGTGTRGETHIPLPVDTMPPKR